MHRPTLRQLGVRPDRPPGDGRGAPAMTPSCRGSSSTSNPRARVTDGDAQIDGLRSARDRSDEVRRVLREQLEVGARESTVPALPGAARSTSRQVSARPSPFRTPSQVVVADLAEHLVPVRGRRRGSSARRTRSPRSTTRAGRRRTARGTAASIVDPISLLAREPVVGDGGVVGVDVHQVDEPTRVVTDGLEQHEGVEQRVQRRAQPMGSSLGLEQVHPAADPPRAGASGRTRGRRRGPRAARGPGRRRTPAPRRTPRARPRPRHRPGPAARPCR